jgi:hypothetical protein
MIDPTGYSSFGISGQMATVSVSSSLSSISSITLTGVRFVGRTFVAAATYSLAGIKHEIKRCHRSRGKKCRIPNIVFIGSDLPAAQAHIADAQLGLGSNKFPISPVVTYIRKTPKQKSRSFLKRTKECSVSLAGRQCDEYPFMASAEGGKLRYDAGLVSLRRINAGQNGKAGVLWGKAIGGRSTKYLGKKFIIAPYGGASFYIRDGKLGR